MLTINTTTRYDVLSCMPIFKLLVNENDFSVPVECHRFLKSHDITLHVSFHWQNKCHYEKFEHVIVMITWSGNTTIDRKSISGLNHIVTSVANNVANPLSFAMSLLHDKSSWYSQSNLKERYGFCLNKETLKFTSIDTVTKLCRGIM